MPHHPALRHRHRHHRRRRRPPPRPHVEPEPSNAATTARIPPIQQPTANSLPIKNQVVPLSHPNSLSIASSVSLTEATLPISPLPVLPQPRPESARFYSDASSCRPHWRSAISSWTTSDPSRSAHCNRILDHIENGIPIDPSSMPIDKHIPNTPTINANADAVRKQLDYYLQMGAVEPCSRTDIVAVHPLHCVIKPDRKPRVVVDFSLNLNDYLTVPQMRYASSIDAAVAGSKLGCLFQIGYQGLFSLIHHPW